MEVIRAILQRLIDLIDYQEVHLLGVGSFGHVSEVRKGDRTMALKIVKCEEMNKFSTKVSFFREIFTQILAAHPCIVAIEG
jgi:hypothetical protein